MGFTYIGAVVGAGFASGQEILQFFTVFGPVGGLGIAVACLLFAAFGAQLLLEGYRSRATSHRDVVNGLGPPCMGTMLDATVTLFLFSSLVAMAAGAGAVAAQFGFAYPGLASLAMLLVAAFTVAAGVGTVVATIGGVAPFMVVMVVVVSVTSVLAPRDCLEPIAPVMTPAVHHWLTSAVLYVSYNILGCVSILAPMGATMRRQSDAWMAAAVGGVGLGIGAYASHLAMQANTGAMAAGVPLVALADSVSPLLAKAYALVIVAEVFTTAVAALYGLMARLTGRGAGRGAPSRAGMASVLGLAWLLSRLGLQEVVRTVYPAMGAMGVLLLAALTRQAARRWLAHLSRK